MRRWDGQFDAEEGRVGEDLHCTERQDQGDHGLLAFGHLQVPDEEPGKDSKNPVADASDGRVCVGSVDGDFGAHAGAFGAGELGPEVGRWATLKYEKEKEDGRVHLCDDDCGYYGEAVRVVDCEAQQHDGDAEFDGHIGEDIGWLTLFACVSSYCFMPLAPRFGREGGQCLGGVAAESGDAPTPS